MSDTPPGPDWWLASDGKWYPPRPTASANQPPPPPPASPLPPPPSSAPPPPAASPPPPSAAPPLPTAPPLPPGSGGAPVYGTLPPDATVATPGPALSKGLSGTLQGFLWATAGFAAVSAPLALATLVKFNDYWDTPIDSFEELVALEDFADVEDAMVGFQGGMWLAWLVALILMMIWGNLAHKTTTQRLWSGDRQWSSGWTVGAWFIPLANLLVPKLVLTEIEQIACAPRRGGRADADWRHRPAAAIGWVWWVLMVAGFVAVGVGMALVPDVTEEFSADTVRASYILRAVGFALVAAGCACGALYVRRISNRLSAEGLAAP